MGLIIGLVFVGVFAVVAMPWIASSCWSRQEGQGGADQAGVGTGYRSAGAARPGRESSQGRSDQQHSLAEQEAAAVRTDALPAQGAGPGQPELERGQAADDERGVLCGSVLPC